MVHVDPRSRGVHSQFGVARRLGRRRISVHGVLHAYAGGTLFGEPYGPQPARILALHGWGHDHHDFDELLRIDNRNFSAIALDLPGFGASPVPEVPWGSVEYAEHLVGVLDEMDPQPIILGHSFGGRVALALAERYPDRIGGLVLTGVPLLPVESHVRSPFGYRAVRALRRYRLVSEEQLERARQHYGSSDYRTAHGVMRQILVQLVNERYEQMITSVDTRVELVWGELDTTAPVAQARQAAQLFRNASLTVVPGVGHMPLSGAGDELASALDRLMR